MTYSVEILRSAQKQLARIANPERNNIIAAIWKLADTPRPRGCRKLSGRQAWRIRVGRYRVIYEIHDRQLIVTIISIGHRRDIYNLRR